MANVSRSRVTWAVFGFFVTVGVLLSAQASAEKKTDRDADGLFGPVRWVVSEWAELSRSFDEWVDGPRRTSEYTTYNSAGYVLERREYEHSVFGKVTWIEKWVFSYNSKGAVVDCRSYSARGTPWKKRVFQYNAQGRLTGWTTYSATGDFVYGKTVLHLDAVGNVVNREDYDSHGRLIAPLPEVSSTGRIGTDTYDSRGNWVKKTVFKLRSGFGETYWEPVTRHYRTIAYYGEPSPPVPKTLETMTEVQQRNQMELTVLLISIVAIIGIPVLVYILLDHYAFL